MTFLLERRTIRRPGKKEKARFLGGEWVDSILPEKAATESIAQFLGTHSNGASICL